MLRGGGIAVVLIVRECGGLAGASAASPGTPYPTNDGGASEASELPLDVDGRRDLPDLLDFFEWKLSSDFRPDTGWKSFSME